MVGTTTRIASASAILLVAALSTAAQERREQIIIHQDGHAADTLFFEQAQPIDKTAMTGWIVTEFGFGGEAVKGAPYSADAVTENTQTLGDGNRIVRSSKSVLYRDGLGRTRREETLAPAGPFAAGRQSEAVIFVNDPVTRVDYTLFPGSRTARRFDRSQVPQGFGIAPSRDAVVHIEAETRASTAGGGAPRFGRGTIESRARVAGGETGAVNYAWTNRADSTFHTSAAKNESLGTRLIDGIVAEGIRSTVTIPAGEIGNERPIDIVSERWYSPELQVVLSMRHSDPRFGENHYYLTNIRRGEPPASLFEVPSDYKVENALTKIERKPE